MRIGTKLFVALAVPITVLIVLFAWLDERDSRERTRDELAREGRAISRTVQLAMEFALRDRQLADVHQLIDQITGFERVLGIRLFNRDGSLNYQSPGLAHVPPVSRADVVGTLRTGTTQLTRSVIDHHSVVAYLAPLIGPAGNLFGAVQVLQLESFIEEDARASRRSIAVFTAIMVLAVGGILYMVTRVSLSLPIGELMRSVRDVGSGDFHSRVRVRRNDELGHLAGEFNTMCARLENTRLSLLREQEGRRRVEISLREAERLASVGRLAAGLAHEIGTPLNVIGGRAELMLRRGGLPAADERNLRIIATQIERIARIVHGMLDFSRVRELRPAPTSVCGVLERVAELVGPRLEQSQVRIEWGLPQRLPDIQAEADRLEQVFLNLAVNAADAMPNGGTLRFEVAQVERIHPEIGGAPRALQAITVIDTGRGIPPEHLERVFDPFFTTKEVGSGTGLGLSISYGIVQEHGGWIEIDSRPGAGTRVTVLLPLEQPGALAATAPAEEVAS